MKDRPISHHALFLVLLVFISLQSHAGNAPTEPVTNPQPTDQQQALAQVREELSTMDRRWYGLMRIRWSDTQLFSAGLGAMWVKQPEQVNCSLGCEIKGWHFEVEPGVYGIQAGFGWGKLVGETGRTSRLMHTVHFGWDVRAVVLRTWGDSTLYPQSQTLAGLEVGVSIIRMNISAGLLRSLYSGPGSEYSEKWVVTAGLGWGF